MTLNVDELQAKTEALRQEITGYAQSAQEEINKLQQDLQAKVRDSQRIIDQKQGQLSALENLIKEMGPQTSELIQPENN